LKIFQTIALLLGVYTVTLASDPFPPGKLVERVVCKTDVSQSYALYIPIKGNKGPLPVVYLFDPHGDGTLPLKKYKSLADAYGFIFVGSNNSKNGNDWQTTENIWQHLSDDTKTRLRIDDKRVYTCGFSGGAKVASYVALQHQGIKGVLVGGAGLPDGVPAGNMSFSLTIMAGEGDMNLTDLVAMNNELDRTRTRHRIIIFDGKHEWAPSNIMNLAFAGLQFDAMRDGTIPRDNASIQAYAAKSKARLSDYNKAGQLLMAHHECSLSSLQLEGLTDEASWFKQQLTALTNNPRYQQQRQAQEALLAREQNIKAGYMQHFQQEDRPYWTTVIHDLQSRAAVKSPEKGMYQRLLAYLSLAFYSLSSRLIIANENNGARYFTDLYKLADPTNSEAWYFSAILHVRERNTQAAESDLLKAVENGFNDKGRLTQQPEFTTLDKSRVMAAIQRGSSQ
jgi:dienelactone hydrolase